jgi:uncharacterized protein (TIGR00369 family)
VSAFTPAEEGFEQMVRASFNRQGAMRLIGARLALVEPGLVEIELPFRADLTQQHGFFHAGVTSMIADTAGGYAALSLLPAGETMLTVEFKINLLAPATGDRLLATGRVVKPGRTLTVCTLEVHAVAAGESKLCAFGLQTMMSLAARPGLAEG